MLNDALIRTSDPGGKPWGVVAAWR